jgi:hypothetical protein
MNGMPTAAAAGKVDLGGDLRVNWLGFGAMGISVPDHFEENIAAASLELTPDDIQAINRAVLS